MTKLIIMIIGIWIVVAIAMFAQYKMAPNNAGASYMAIIIAVITSYYWIYLYNIGEL